MSRQLAGRLLVLAIAASEGAGGCANGGDDSRNQSAGAGGAAGVAAAGIGGAAGIAGAANVAGAAGGAGAASGGAAGANAGGANAAGAGGAGSTAPTFTRVWNEVLVAKGCAGEFCHGGAQGGLSMDDRADAHANLVGVTAAGPLCGTSGKLRVQPSAPDASLLLEKMSQPMPSCGETMPIGTKLEPNCLVDDPSVCTTAAELQLVRDWIAAGALDD
jgi:hypothetical protein